MDIIHALERPDGPNPHGVSAKGLFASDHAQVTLVTLEPGEALKLHVTPVDALFYVLEGTGVVEIDGEQQTVTENDLVFSPKRIAHRLLNRGDVVFRFLVVKTPAQKEATKLL